MRYIKSFNTDADVQTALSNGELGKPYVAYITSTGKIDWNTKDASHDYSKDYLTIEALENGNIVWHTYYNLVYYRINGGNWVTGGTEREQINITIPVVSGDIVEFKGNATRDNYFSATTCNVNVYGNVNSIKLGDNFIGDKTTLPVKTLFNKNTKILNAANLILPATTLATSCYLDMFSGCTSLTSAPELPATTLAASCYRGMFKGCTNLIKAPELRAESVNMCYREMFNGCINLNYIKCLTTNLTLTNFQAWVTGVQTNSGTFIKKSGTNWSRGNNGIPNNWTIQNA